MVDTKQEYYYDKSTKQIMKRNLYSFDGKEWKTSVTMPIDYYLEHRHLMPCDPIVYNHQFHKKHKPHTFKVNPISEILKWQ